jgi:hypothetical protein
MVAQVILFENAGFQGRHKHVFGDIENLSTQDDGDFNSFNDLTSSLAVVEGYWEFFADWKWENSLGILGPGAYASVTEALGSNANDVITGIRQVTEVTIGVRGKTATHKSR